MAYILVGRKSREDLRGVNILKREREYEHTQRKSCGIFKELITNILKSENFVYVCMPYVGGGSTGQTEGNIGLSGAGALGSCKGPNMGVLTC